MGKRHLPESPEMSAPHIPVLLDEVCGRICAACWPAHRRLALLARGGYSRTLLDAGAEVVAIDRDPNVKPHAERLAVDFPGRFHFVPGTFSELDTLAAAFWRPSMASCLISA
ncbi:hypothetical protein HA402_005563 [Bradysia odoriphaga]|nr:hypothetical protein HA402_005563 [Bradysia odoriphaga]